MLAATEVYDGTVENYRVPITGCGCRGELRRAFFENADGDLSGASEELGTAKCSEATAIAIT